MEGIKCGDFLMFFTHGLKEWKQKLMNNEWILVIVKKPISCIFHKDDNEFLQFCYKILFYLQLIKKNKTNNSLSELLLEKKIHLPLLITTRTTKENRTDKVLIVLD